MSALFLMTIAGFLSYWQELGVFAYVLPFMLIFALVFGILMQAKFLGENKGVNAIIALAIALLALQFQKVPDFFANISSNLAIGIFVLLAALILMGLFIDFDDDKYKNWKYGFAAFGGVVAIIVILVSLSDSNISGNFGWWDTYWPHIIIALAIVGGIIAVIATTEAKKPKIPKASGG